MQTVDTLKIAGQENFHRLQQWSEDRHFPLQTVGLVALAGVTGMTLGVIVAKGILATKGVSAIGAARGHSAKRRDHPHRGGHFAG